jgi:hypothetical protein
MGEEDECQKRHDKSSGEAGGQAGPGRDTEDNENDKCTVQEDVVCRYCLDEHPKAELFCPCRCTTPVHTSCLRRWLTSRTGSQQQVQAQLQSHRLRCELCNGPIAARVSLAHCSVLVKDHEGRSILFSTLLRFAYRIFLFRRLLTRYRPILNRWRDICTRKNPLDDGIRGFFERASLYRDSLMGVMLGWLCCHMFSRDIRSFLDAFSLLRAKKSTLTFLLDGAHKAPCPLHTGGSHAHARTHTNGGDALSRIASDNDTTDMLPTRPVPSRVLADLRRSFRWLLSPVWSLARRHGFNTGMSVPCSSSTTFIRACLYCWVQYVPVTVTPE